MVEIPSTSTTNPVIQHVNYIDKPSTSTTSIETANVSINFVNHKKYIEWRYLGKSIISRTN